MNQEQKRYLAKRILEEKHDIIRNILIKYNKRVDDITNKYYNKRFEAIKNKDFEFKEDFNISGEYFYVNKLIFKFDSPKELDYNYINSKRNKIQSEIEKEFTKLFDKLYLGNSEELLEKLENIKSMDFTYLLED